MWVTRVDGWWRRTFWKPRSGKLRYSWVLLAIRMRVLPRTFLAADAGDFLVLFTRFHYFISVSHLLFLKRGLNILDTLFLLHPGSGDGSAYWLENWLLPPHGGSHLSRTERAMHYHLILDPGMVVWHRVGHLGKRLRLLYIWGNMCKNIRRLERSRDCSSSKIRSSSFWAHRWAFSKPPLDWGVVCD